MDCPTCTGSVRQLDDMVCPTCGTDYGTPFEVVPYSPDGPPPAAPFELLAIWAETQDVARAAAWCLGLNTRQVLALGNRSADTLRGVDPTRVLILPGADSAAVEQALAITCGLNPLISVLDLRAVQA